MASRPKRNSKLNKTTKSKFPLQINKSRTSSKNSTSPIDSRASSTKTGTLSLIQVQAALAYAKNSPRLPSNRYEDLRLKLFQTLQGKRVLPDCRFQVQVTTTINSDKKWSSHNLPMTISLDKKNLKWYSLKKIKTFTPHKISIKSVTLFTFGLSSCSETGKKDSTKNTTRRKRKKKPNLSKGTTRLNANFKVNHTQIKVSWKYWKTNLATRTW